MHPIHVLLVDDDPEHQELLRLALSRAQHRPQLTAVSTRAAMLDAIGRHTFDCIVLDFNIPPHTAPDLIKDLHQAVPETPILVISSSEAQSVVVESLRNGVADFVPKDVAFCSQELSQRIEGVVAIARQRKTDRRASSRRLRTLERDAGTDLLTGLHNRRFVQQLSKDTQVRGDRRVRTGVAMLDIDHFKRVNDTYGHAAGDEVLRAVAGAIRECSEPSDILARWGGEEFIMLRPSASLSDAWSWAERVRGAIAGLAVVVGDQTIKVTASLGVTEVATRTWSEEGAAQADRALYLAKDLGRDRVCSWPMLCAMERAEDVQSIPETTPHQRMIALREMLLPTLGPTQRNHVCEHSAAVAAVAVSLGGVLGLTRAEIETLAQAAEFHDIGKTVIPEELLGSSGRLSGPERRFINEHARYGAELLLAAGAEDAVADLVRAHHVRFDEPCRVAGLSLMVLSAADSLMAMLSARPYADAKTMPQAIRELRAQSGRQFDPRVVDALVETKDVVRAVGCALDLNEADRTEAGESVGATGGH